MINHQIRVAEVQRHRYAFTENLPLHVTKLTTLHLFPAEWRTTSQLYHVSNSTSHPPCMVAAAAAAHCLSISGKLMRCGGREGTRRGRAPHLKCITHRTGLSQGSVRQTELARGRGSTSQQEDATFPTVNTTEPVQSVGSLTLKQSQKNTITTICATAAWTCLKTLTEKYLLTSLHLLDRYDTHNYSCYVYILLCCL